MPEVVERELEEQFVRSVTAAYGTLEQSAKEINKLCRHVIAVNIKGTQPDEDQLRLAFRARSDQLKAHFGISTIPLTSLDLRTFVDMAISRTAPFEEYEIGKHKVVVGLQDTAILFSILDHMKSAADQDRCTLISSDHIFHATETRKLVELTGIKLGTHKKVSELFDDLFNHVWDAIGNPHCS